MWTRLTSPTDLGPPSPLLVRVETIPARHFINDHAHAWNQLVYAISGVLTVTMERSCFVIPPEQAVWVPAGHVHRVGSLLGAEFRSLWIAADAGRDVGEECTVFSVSPLLRALIIEAGELQRETGDGAYAQRVSTLILDQLRRAPSGPAALPWPRSGPLQTLCEALYSDPSDTRGPEEWATTVGLSARTLARRFNEEIGMNLRTWRRRLRLLRAIELLDGGGTVTETALALGYSSPSAFIYAFRRELGQSPAAHLNAQRNLLGR